MWQVESLSCRRTIIGGCRHIHKIAISGQSPCVQLFKAPIGVVKDVHLTLSWPALRNFGCPHLRRQGDEFSRSRSLTYRVGMPELCGDIVGIAIFCAARRRLQDVPLEHDVMFVKT
jgi:hypothetical protein